jgi:subtilisin family serine protease
MSCIAAMRRSLPNLSRLTALAATLLAVTALPATAAQRPQTKLIVVGYTSKAALRTALAASGARLVRVVPQLKVAEVRTAPAALQALQDLRGIRYAHRPVLRQSLVEPGLAPAAVMGGAYEWQYAAAHEDSVPANVLRAASSITVAVIDTGADVTAPDLAAKSPTTWSILDGTTDVTDWYGHGTFVSSLAVGSGTNGDGVAGFGGDAKLLVVQAGDPYGEFTDVAEAAAIAYAVDHGAKIINMSFGGPETSETERAAVNYAAAHGVLLVASAGNSGADDNLTHYPAALLQPVGSDGQDGIGLAVGASTIAGARADFSNFGSYVSLAAPGEDVFGAVSSDADPAMWDPLPLPGSSAGLYAYSSGTSFSAPEVAGAAALVWAANPTLTAQDVAGVLKASASGNGAWNEDIGYGILNVAAAVARAQAIALGAPPVTLAATRAGTHVTLSWSAPRAASYQLRVSEDGARPQILLGATTATSAGYDLDRGHSYTFSVLATDIYGLTSFSTPWTVSAPFYPAALALRASPTVGKKKLRVTVWAVLTPADTATGRAGRTVALESFDGETWNQFAQTKTNGTGLAAWNLKFRRGRYLVRAVFAGADDLDATVSRGVKIRVR